MLLISHLCNQDTLAMKFLLSNTSVNSSTTHVALCTDKPEAIYGGSFTFARTSRAGSIRATHATYLSDDIHDMIIMLR
jgi:hypothetical protein